MVAAVKRKLFQVFAYNREGEKLVCIVWATDPDEAMEMTRHSIGKGSKIAKCHRWPEESFAIVIQATDDLF